MFRRSKRISWLYSQNRSLKTLPNMRDQTKEYFTGGICYPGRVWTDGVEAGRLPRRAKMPPEGNPEGSISWIKHKLLNKYLRNSFYLKIFLERIKRHHYKYSADLTQKKWLSTPKMYSRGIAANRNAIKLHSRNCFEKWYCNQRRKIQCHCNMQISFSLHICLVRLNLNQQLSQIGLMFCEGH